MFNVEGLHVLDVTTRDDGALMLDVETDEVLAGCAGCGVVAVGHGRRVVRLHDTPCFGRPVLVRWRKRIWRCAEDWCVVSTWTETHGYAAERSKLTARAISWAVDALRHDDTTVSAIARHLGVDWHTAWAAIKAEARRRVKRPERLKGVKTLGVDEHIWRPSMRSTSKAVTVMVDLTRDADGCLHARLRDAVEGGRSGTVYADWLKDEGLEVTVTVEHAALDPFRGYANAIRDELPDAVAVLDAFYVVKLGSTALDEVRRRVQQQTLHRRGHKDDPLYRIRRTLMTGGEHLSEKQKARLDKTSSSRPVTRTARSTWLGWPINDSGRSTTHRVLRPDDGSPSSSSTCYTPARSPSSPGSAERWGSGGPRSWPTSPPAGSTTEAPKRSTESSRRPGDWPTSSETSRTTGSESCSPPTELGPTASGLPMLDSEEPINHAPRLAETDLHAGRT